jgi:septum formation protein
MMNNKIILASASPRRAELLGKIGLVFDTIHSDVEENLDAAKSPEELAKELSYLKARDVASRYEAHNPDVQSAIVIGADTIVVKDSVLGKPVGRQQAFEMLKQLQGGWHTVITGITVIKTHSGESVTDYEKTRVKIKDLHDDMIWAYVDTGEPLDKAGAYGIQEKGGLIVERIDGCYFNVVGLPLMKLSIILNRFGIKTL